MQQDEMRSVIRPACPGREMREATSEARQAVIDELYRVTGRLHAMVAAYEERPRTFDDDMLKAAGSATMVEKLIAEIYSIMQAGIFVEDSPLRSCEDEWIAFMEHHEELRFFHRSALNAVEYYQEVLQTYALVKQIVRRCPGPDSSARIWEDKRIQLSERESCIEAVANLERKLSAMLIIFARRHNLHD
jgi:hypothetical protein